MQMIYNYYNAQHKSMRLNIPELNEYLIIIPSRKDKFT